MLKTAAARVYAWIDERTGVDEILHTILDEPIPGGASFAYVFGSALIFLFTLQVITGIFLAMYYVPSIEDAHRTVEYISKVVSSGSFIRGIHHYGASAMIILVGCHILQVIVWGSYKKKREMVWLMGVGLLMLILAFALTGYLLPWDMKAYFGTQVTVNIASETPVIGDTIKRIMLGGPTLGTITLSRFFMVHALILPGVTAGGIALHIYFFRKAKPAGPFHLTEQEAEAKVELFYPKQVFKDMLVAVIIFGALSLLTILHPAPLEPRANPGDVTYIARPEWYFLSLFQLLKYFQGPLAIVGSMVIPGIMFSLLALLPFLDRRAERNPFKRPIVMVCTLAVVSAMGVLTFMAKTDDQAKYGSQFAKQANDGDVFLRYQPFKPKEIGGKAAIPPPPEVFKNRCAGCHGSKGEGGFGPKLTGVKWKKDEIIQLIQKPSDFGAKKMPPVDGLTPEEREAIADWIISLKE